MTAGKHTETQLRRQAKSEQLINQTAQKIRQSLNLDRILETTVTEIQQLLHCDRLIVYQFTDSIKGIITAEATAPGIEGTLHRSFEDNCFGDVCQNVYLQGYYTLVSDIENRTNLDPCYHAMLRELKVKANLVVPILLREESPDAQTQTLNSGDSSLPTIVANPIPGMPTKSNCYRISPCNWPSPSNKRNSTNKFNPNCKSDAKPKPPYGNSTKS